MITLYCYMWCGAKLISFTGFAFVLMEDPRDAEDAVKGLDGSRVCGRRIKVRSLIILSTIRNYGPGLIKVSSFLQKTD